MPRQSITWLITDTHFYHNVMVERCGWPPDYIGKIIKNCQHLVAQQDLLLHLGDVIFYRHKTLKDILAKIPGKKILIRGNHDKGHSNGWFMRNGFDFVANQIVLDNVLFSHIPQPIFPKEVDYNIHGHFHDTSYSTMAWYPFYDSSKHFHLSIEQNKFAPVRLIDFLKTNIRNK